MCSEKKWNGKKVEGKERWKKRGQGKGGKKR